MTFQDLISSLMSSNLKKITETPILYFHDMISHLDLYLKIDYSAGNMAFSVWLAEVVVVVWVAQAVEGCPHICKCTRKSSPEKSEVHCHKRGLDTFPSNLPPDAWVLHLSTYLVVYKKYLNMFSILKIIVIRIYVSFANISFADSLLLHD